MIPDATNANATESATDAGTQQPLWQERDGAPGFAEAAANEFPEGATEFAGDEASRRTFIKLMGASAALASAGCYIRPAAQRKIHPYTTQPDELTPGLPNYYATATVHAGYGEPALVRQNEGRPTKIEGNPDHPSSLGGSSLFSQASILDVYDPDRSRSATRRGLPVGYEAVVSALRSKMYTGNAANAGLKLRILTETVTSPTLAKYIKDVLVAFPQAKWVQYSAVGNENAKKGLQTAYGKPVSAVYDFVKADVVLSLDADFTGIGPGAVRYARDFADRRKIRHDGKTLAECAAGREPGKPFKDGVKPDALNRLYAVECMPTNTGAVADHRLALRTADIGSLTRTLAAKLGVAGVAPAGEWKAEQVAWVDALVKDLQSKAGKGVVVAGDHLPDWVHALVAAINEKLTNVGANKPVKLIEPVEGRADKPEQNGDLAGFVKDASAKQVDAVLILAGANPAYTAPADIDFAGALKNVPLAVHLGSHQDETAVLCEWHLNESHPLETWGDVRGHDGTVIVQQPLIAPLFGGRSAIELLAALVPGANGVPGTSMTPESLVSAYWAKWHADAKIPGAFKTFWDTALRAGAIPGTASPAAASALAAGATSGIPAPVATGEYELNFRPCPALYDGRHANNGWLQELPKPLTKICWDNAAFVSPATAEKMASKVDFRWTAGEHGRAEVHIAEIEVNGKKLKLPIWGLPGHADGAITVHLGHGRLRAGSHVGNNAKAENAEGQQAHGTNVYPARTSATLWAAPAKITRTAQKYFLANNQGNWSMVERDPISGKPLDRKPVRFGTLAEYDKNPKFAKITPAASGESEAIDANMPYPKVLKKDDHKHDDKKHDAHHDKRLHPLNMYNPAEGLSPDLNPAQRRRWAMAIDLNACNGCSACVVACQSENNIPVVGKEQVTKGREMYWINVDRYYSGDEKDPNAVRAYFQPRACVQCENAPCEIVCPVGATVHSTDGLNDMAYNRCVGTRYCSNNCPYKVRRFNFLTFQDWETDTIKLGRNPEVSVRSRGVMEKCSFCVQRIRAAEIVAERELAKGLRKLPDPEKGEVLIRDGEIITACQAACPAGAIAFGDINDPTAVVSHWKNEPANFGLLAELNTRPRLTYLAVVRNPNPALAK